MTGGFFYCLMKSTIALYLLILAASIQAQNSLTCIVADSLSGETLTGVNVFVKNTTNGTSTDVDGLARLDDIPSGLQTIEFSYVGYETRSRLFEFPLEQPDAVQQILLTPSAEELEEVIVSSTRTNARIEDLPVKVEVLGQEELDEESTLVPGGLGSLLGDLSVITIQRTNPVNGNEVLRMQGLDARYTQILRDGLPLYGGFSGSLGLLSIPPLDLRQVEIIKGSASTIYGGGAIGGLINLLSKAPADEPKATFVLNGTSLGESNANAFFSRQMDKVGLTFFSGSNVKFARDVNDDGFAEVPFDANFSVHPRLFFNLGEKTDLNVGLTGSYDRRKGGDLAAIRFQPTDEHPFYQTEEAFRSTLDLQFCRQNKQGAFTIKAAGSVFDRTSTSPGFYFQGQQINTFAEVNNLWEWRGSSLVVGMNLQTEDFSQDKQAPLPSWEYSYVLPGLFAQNDWQVTEKFSIGTGLRMDYHNRYGSFVLPRISLYYKPVESVSVRLAFGTGYRIPSLFELAEPSPTLSPLAEEVKPERSRGFNADINWHRLLGDELGLTLNQAFYFTGIDNYHLLLWNGTDSTFYVANSSGEVRSYGTDTYVQADWRGLELYLGFNLTDAFRRENGEKINLAFNPKHKISTVVAYEIGEIWRLGIESSYSGNQFVEDNRKVDNFWFFAAMVERKFRFGSLVLNCENLFDARQAKKEALVTGGFQAPQFASIWMPVEGRVVNLAIKVAW